MTQDIPATTDQKTTLYRFSRYRPGVGLLAEGAETRAASEAEARKKVRARYAGLRSCARDEYRLEPASAE